MSGKIRKPPSCEPLKFRSKEAFRGRQAEFKPYEMGMHVPSGMDSKVSEKSIIRPVAAISGPINQGPRRPKGKRDFGGASHARSCSYVDLDPTQVCGLAGGRVSQG